MSPGNRSPSARLFTTSGSVCRGSRVARWRRVGSGYLLGSRRTPKSKTIRVVIPVARESCCIKKQRDGTTVRAPAAVGFTNCSSGREKWPAERACSWTVEGDVVWGAAPEAKGSESMTGIVGAVYEGHGRSRQGLAETRSQYRNRDSGRFKLSREPPSLSAPRSRIRYIMPEI